MKVLLELVKETISINAQDVDGKTALHLAVENKSDNAVKILLSNGADCLIVDSHFQTPLHLLLQWNRPKVTLRVID